MGGRASNLSHQDSTYLAQGLLDSSLGSQGHLGILKADLHSNQGRRITMGLGAWLGQVQTPALHLVNCAIWRLSWKGGYKIGIIKPLGGWNEMVLVKA